MVRRGTRKLRGGALSAANVEKMADAAKSKLNPPEAKKDVQEMAQSAAYRRWDYQRITKSREKLIVMIRNAGEDLKEMKKNQERIVNEEFVKAADDWIRRTTRKKGWFY